MFRRPTNKAERLAVRAIYIPKGSRLVPGPTGGAAYAYETTNKAGEARYCGIVFRGTSSKSEWHTIYRTITQRDEAIAAFHKSLINSAEFKAKRTSDKAAWVNPLKVGDILHSSWGYDQTNVEFYAVTKVSGRRTWIRMICSDYKETGFMSGTTWPAMPIRFIDQKPLHDEEHADSWTRLLNGHETMHIAQPTGDKCAYIKVSDSIHAWQETGRAHYTSSYA